MTKEEKQLLDILRKESDDFLWGNKELFNSAQTEITTISISNSLYSMALNLMDNSSLCKHFRNMIVLEEYETAALAKLEIEKRGYSINFIDKCINFLPNGDNKKN